jgi:uncharacterized protein (AIM24 family)
MIDDEMNALLNELSMPSAPDLQVPKPTAPMQSQVPLTTQMPTNIRPAQNRMVTPLFEFDGCETIESKKGIRLEVELTRQNPKIWFLPGFMYEINGPAHLGIDSFNLGGLIQQAFTGQKKNLPFVELDNDCESAVFISEEFKYRVVVIDLSLTGPLVIADSRLVAYSGKVQAHIHKNEGSQAMTNTENGMHQLCFSAIGEGHSYIYLQTNNYHPRVIDVNQQYILDRDLFLARSSTLQYTIGSAVKGFWKDGRVGEGLVHKVTGKGLIILENE